MSMVSQQSDVVSLQPDLRNVIEKFKTNVLKLTEVYHKDLEFLKTVRFILKQDTETLNQENDLLNQINEEELHIGMEKLRSRNPTNLRASENDQIVAHNPCIAIVGQTKSGKSTLVNTFLGEYVVPQEPQKCTARITHINYSETNYVQLRHPVKGVLPNSYIELKSSNLPRDYAAMTDLDRNDEEASKVIVEAGVSSDFLKNGVDILDSPGLNENECLDDVVKNMVASVMPFIIYVIDGRKTVTESDIQDIRKIKNACPTLEIFYFVTKLDSQQVGKRQRSEAVEAKRRLTLVFDKLKRNGFIGSDEDMETSQIFHGASLWKVNDSGNDPTNMHVQRFNRMKSCLTSMVASYLDSTIQSVAFTFQHFNECVLEKIIKRASSIFYDTQKKLEDIKNIKEEEMKINEKVIEFLTGSEGELKNKLTQFLEENEEILLDALTEHKYEDEIPLTGNETTISDLRIIARCVDSVCRTVSVKLDTQIKQYVQAEIVKVYSSAQEIIRQQIDKISVEMMNCKSPYRDMLDKILKNIYDLNSSSSKTRMNIPKVLTILLSALNFLRTLLSLFRESNRPRTMNVHNLEWKREQAKTQFLNQLKAENFPEKVCEKLHNDMAEKHETFINEMELQTHHVTATVKISEESRAELVKMSPDFALLFLKCLAIKNQYEFDGMIRNYKIGEGAEGQVYVYTLGETKYAVKETSIDEQFLGNIAMEIYASSTVHHQRLIPLSGALLKAICYNDYFNVSKIMPLMKYDSVYLLTRKKPSLLTRLKLALQVSEALIYLHDEGIMHRDLKLANILIDQDDNAVVGDYGFLKKESLSNGTFAGTPVHIAPEIVRRETKYDLSVDVYSFGILMWYFAEGTGRHPKYTDECNNVTRVLQAADDGARPERLNHISDSLWQLMCDCWVDEAKQRPTMKEVHYRLDKIIQEME